jgi:hypothetical protein
MRPTRTLFLMLPILCGCGAAQLVLKPPIESQCNSTGLKGCPELTEGVIFYVEGDKPKGKDQILRGAAQNAPENVRKFAQAIKSMQLDKIPGAAKYTKVLLEVADILATAKGADGPAGGPAVAQGGAPAQGGVVVDGSRDGGTITPKTASGKTTCGGQLPGYGLCVWVTAGPLVLTDLQASPACPAEMAAGAAKLVDGVGGARWVAHNPHGLGSQQAQVRAGESLFIGVQAAGAADPRCSLTWAGYRPNDGR